MLKSTDGGLRTVPFPVEDPERIPVKRYYDEEFYQAELDHLWPHVWQMACRLEQIPEVGDWVEYSNVGKSVIVVNTNDGVKAFHNACRHRGVPIAGGMGTDCGKLAHGNCSKTGFVCPFHGWRWNMDGENTFVYGQQLFSEKQLDPDDINLVPCRVETWGGCAFINFDDEAASLLDCLGPVAENLDAHGMSKLRAEWWYGTVLPANWKIAMEAFQEGYHVMQTHPQLQKALPFLYDAIYGSASPTGEMAGVESIGAMVKDHVHHYELLSEGMAGMTHEKELEFIKKVGDEGLPDDPMMATGEWFMKVRAEISKGLQERGEEVPDLAAAAINNPVNALEFLFPHYFLLPNWSSMSSYRIRPLGPESCFFEIWSLTQFPKGEEPEAPMEPTVLPYDSQEFPPIPKQDYSNIPIQQKGLHAKGFEFMRLSKEKEGMISNYQRIIDGYLAGVPQEKLAKAITELGGNFDGPIKELDL